MRLALQTVICCCVFTMVLPLVKGATGELNSSLKKRFKIWLQGRMKRDLGNSLVTANERHSDIHVGPQQGENAKAVSPSLSFGLKFRPRRSSSKASGCVLGTCVYHDLIHQLHKIRNNDQKEPKAPPEKIGCTGYGRRRRSLLDVSQFALQSGRQRRSTEAGQQVHIHKSKCTVA
ncbi:ADM-like [Seriola lalandi dorsalis]|uniref:ADM-like n=1 Tax=Seriola lalandi dorsalis TaxID=1841481 RepID=A0A3B4WXD2_SERLL|nr:ADM-like [Seriola lalandi dorsalis]XP_056243278.1 pro-adrenomedullin [Seriola aureovittata]